MLLSEWLDQWLEQMALTLRPSTLEHYRQDMEHHVKPYLVQKKLTQITASDLRKLYDRLKAHGRVNPRPGQSPGFSSITVHGIHTTLHQALKAAANQGLMPSNPAEQVESPKIDHKPMKILNSKQMETFLVAVEKAPIWYDFFYTELTTGLRLGEICGLMWSDFDEQKGIRTSTALCTGRKADDWWQVTLRPTPGLEKSSYPPARWSCCEPAKRVSTLLGSSMIRCTRSPL